MPAVAPERKRSSTRRTVFPAVFVESTANASCKISVRLVNSNTSFSWTVLFTFLMQDSHNGIPQRSLRLAATCITG